MCRSTRICDVERIFLVCFCENGLQGESALFHLPYRQQNHKPELSLEYKHPKTMKTIACLLLASTASAFSPVSITNTPTTQLWADATATGLGAAGVSSLTKDLEVVFDSTEIDKILPHRYPFALVDKVIEYTPGESAVGVKSVTKVIV